MANFNKVILIGRLTKDPEARTFTNGGKVVKFSFVTNNRKKNAQSGEWEDDPMFIECDVFNRGEHGKLADTVERLARKGSQVCIEGKLILDRWDDKTTGQKRERHKVVVDSFQMLDRREGGGEGEDGEEQPRAYSRPAAPARGGNGPVRKAPTRPEPAYDDGPGGDDDIPF